MGARGPKSIIERSMPNPRQRTTKIEFRPTPKPPKYLRPDTQAWWNSVVVNYDLEDHAVRILLVACETYDRREQARELLAKKGLTFTDAKGMVRQRPECAIERDCAAAFLRAVRALKLEGPPPTQDPTPWLRDG
jgi:phage terminase small subunit